jgi:hypothetical protein
VADLRELLAAVAGDLERLAADQGVPVGTLLYITVKRALRWK